MPGGRELPPRDESLPAEERLRRGADFKRCYQRGRRTHGKHFILYAAPNGRGGPRLGMTVSRKVGGSVVRSRTKRRIREIYRRSDHRSRLPPVDLVVHARPSAGAAEFHETKEDLERLLRKLGKPTSAGRAS